MNEQHAPPNHHADYPGFRGVAGLVAALSMAFGRKGDAQLAVRLSGMGSGDRVVDVGCGPGVAVRYAARLGATVTGVDPAPVMLRTARLLTRRSAKVRYVKGAAEDDSAFRRFCFGSVVDRDCAPLVGHRRRTPRGAAGAHPRRPAGRHGAEGRTRCPRAREPWLDRRTSRRLCRSVPRTRVHRSSLGAGNNRASINGQCGS